MSDKPNCYECKHRGTIPGDVHSRCNHPKIKKVMNDPVAQILALFGSVGWSYPATVAIDGINVTGNEQGISKGWFNWPFNFDPTWLDTCDGWEEKE